MSDVVAVAWLVGWKKPNSLVTGDPVKAIYNAVLGTSRPIRKRRVTTSGALNGASSFTYRISPPAIIHQRRIFCHQPSIFGPSYSLNRQDLNTITDLIAQLAYQCCVRN